MNKNKLRSSQDSNLGLLNSGQMFLLTEDSSMMWNKYTV